jgi:glycosyltransferase involved in cell wall biosynthesis
LIVKFDPFGVGGASIIQSQIDRNLRLLGDLSSYNNSEFSKLVRLLSKHNYHPNLVVLQGIFSTKGLILAIICWLRGIPYIYFSQGSFLPNWRHYYQTNSFLLKKIYWAIFGGIIRSARYIIINSEYEFLTISKWIKSESNLLLLPWNPILYIDEKKSESIESKNYNVITPIWNDSNFSLESSNFVIYSGRISQEKNINFLFRVWEKMNIQGFDVPPYLVIITNGKKEIFKLIQIIKQKSLQNIVLFEWNSGLDLFLINKAKAIVHPSYHESYGLTLIDSLSVGTQIICSKNSMFRDIDRYQLGYSLKYNLMVWQNKLNQILSEKKLSIDKNYSKIYLQNLKVKHDYYLKNFHSILGNEINV